MMFRLTLLMTALLASASAASISKESGGIPATSRLGSKLLSKARIVEDRRLNDEIDYTWVSGYSIKFHACHSLIQIGEGGNNGGGEGSRLYTQNLVTFSLCPTSTCSSSSNTCKDGATYIVDMFEFVDAYTESKMEAAEYACEQARENCNNDDEDACYVDELAYCIEGDDDGEEFNLQEYLECRELENNNNNNNNNGNYNYNQDGYYGQYFVGPYCSSNGKSIHLGVFYDEGCTAKAKESDIYETLNGKSLPYSSESLVANDCISCLEPVEDANDDGNNNNNNNDEEDADEVIEFCEQLYEQSGKCESNINSQYADTSGCEYINNILPRLEQNTKSIKSGSGSGKAAVVFAWLFAATTVALGAYAFLLFRKLRRSKVNLSDQVQETGGTAA